MDTLVEDIDTLGVGTTDFDLSDAKKKDLENSGRTGAENYFKWFNKKAFNHKLNTSADLSR